MQNGRFMTGGKTLIIVIAFYLAAIPLIRFVAAWMSPRVAGALGSPPLQTISPITIAVVMGGTLVHSGLVIVVMAKVWRVISNFARGKVFTRDVVITTRGIGIYLLLLGALDVTTLFIAIGSVITTAKAPSYSSIWLRLLDLPVGALACGLLCLIVARAFAHAVTMATEARLTV